MPLVVRPQTGPFLVWTVIAGVHEGGAACAVAEAPLTPAAVSPANRAPAAATNLTARSGDCFPATKPG